MQEKSYSFQSKLVLPEIIILLSEGSKKGDFKLYAHHSVIADMIYTLTKNLNEKFNFVVIRGIENKTNINYWLECCKAYNKTINLILGTKDLQFLTTGF